MAEEINGQEVMDQAPSSGKNPLITILVVLNTILMGAIGYFQYTTHQKMSSQPNIQDIVKAEVQKATGEVADETTGQAVEQEGKLLKLEGFSANLAQGDGPRRFLRLSMFLKFSTDSQEKEYNARIPQIRDTIISTINTKRPEDLMSVDGKNFLKEELKSAINSFLVEGHVIDVYYVSFQIN